MKRNLLTLVVGAVLILIFVLLLFTFQVRISEVAVVTTFGKPTREITEPRSAPFFKWPWPIQKVYKFDKRVQTFEDKLTEDLTADGNTLNTMVYVGWRITDPKTFFPKFAGGSVMMATGGVEIAPDRQLSASSVAADDLAAPKVDSASNGRFWSSVPKTP